MNLTYNAVNLHDIGTVSLVSETTQCEPSESPQSESIILVFRVDSWKSSGWVDNRTNMEKVKKAIKTQNALLTVAQYAIPGDASSSLLQIYNQTARVVEHNFPSDLNEWGTLRQQIRITFALRKNDVETNAKTCTFSPSGTQTTITLGNVFKWKTGLRTKRYSELKSDIEYQGGAVSASGEIQGDMSLSLADRRIALMASKEALLNAMDDKDGTLTFMDFTKTVRISDVDIDIDQSGEKLVWSFNAIYTRFPNETGFAGADYEVDTKTGTDGEIVLTLSGKVVATDEARARQKFSMVQTAVLGADWGFGNRTSSTVKTRTVSVESDSTTSGTTATSYQGPTFLELSFNETYTKRDPDFMSYTLSIDDTEEGSEGVITRIYSGKVVCGYTTTAGSGGVGISNSDLAYSIAVAKARELGDNKFAVKLSTKIKRDDRLTFRTGSVECVGLEFSFTYKVIGTRIHVELKTETNTQVFGENTINVSGSIAGGSESAITSAYSNIRNLYKTSIVRDERQAWDEIQVQNGSSPSTMAAISIDEEMKFNGTSDRTSLKYKMNFSFSVFSEKTNGSYAIKYGVRISKKFSTLTKTVTVQGSFYGTRTIIDDAQNEVSGNKLDSLLSGLNFGKSVERERNVDYEFIPSVTDRNGMSIKLDFSEVFTSKITGEDAIMECEVEEDIKYSDDRLVVIPRPDGESKVQKMGITEAHRTISGTVSAPNETIALLWAKKMAKMPFRIANSSKGILAPSTPGDEDIYSEGVNFKTKYTFNPFVDGEVRSTDSSIELSNGPTMVMVSFTFNQLIPNYPYVL